MFGEGAMLPLLGVLDQNQHIRNLDLADTAMQFRFRGNGNSNARVLNFILRKNQSIEQLDLSDTGLDDDGLKEIADALKVNKTLKSLKIAGNYFGEIVLCLILFLPSLLMLSKVSMVSEHWQILSPQTPLFPSLTLISQEML
jgi:Ran GTPase-activating protein (RanGAP) involved in mRNA processing and transport